MSTTRKTPGQVLAEAALASNATSVKWDALSDGGKQGVESTASAVIRDFCQRVRERAIEIDVLQTNEYWRFADSLLIAFNELAKEHESK